jgi:DNA-binding beta-propeller fold protein YncE
MGSRADKIAHWEDLTSSLPRTPGWMHSGIAIESDGTIYCAHPDGAALVVMSPDSTRRIVTVPFAELHGIALSRDSGVVAVADPGYRMSHDSSGRRYKDVRVPGKAGLLDATTGEVVLELNQPRVEAYADAGWLPTSIAVDRSSGDIWVADGYGANLVHRFDRTGRHLDSFDGSDSGMTFDCPHGIMLRVRQEAVQVLVADRANHRIVVMAPNGHALHVFGRDDLDSPSSLVEVKGTLFVTELFGGVTQFDEDDRFVRRLEPSRIRDHAEPGWPNLLDDDGVSLRPPQTAPATFNSPHGIAEHAGDLYVTEWMIGGRLVRIRP